MNILIVDDQPDLCYALKEFLDLQNRHNTHIATESGKVLDMCRSLDIQVVISDVNMPVMDGIELAGQLKKELPQIIIILISGEEEIIQSINAFDLGIYDFITKPIDIQKLAATLDEIEREVTVENFTVDFTGLLNREEVRISEITIPDELFFIDGNQRYILASEHMKNIRRKIQKLSRFPQIPVLIEGPTGSGKEMIARMIHGEAGDVHGPFVGLNCGAIDKNLFEAELFGYEKGAFTGADSAGKKGKIALAAGGTLFLDEITEITPDLQVKLLRMLQEKEYYPVGGIHVLPVEARILCATNRDVKEMVRQGKFREDLMYRLDVCKLEIPPLIQRKEDIIPLIIYMVQDICRKNELPIPHTTGNTLRKLMNHKWTGNVRELRNTLMKVLVFFEGAVLLADDFPMLEGLHTHEDDTPRVDFLLPNEPFSLKLLVDQIILQTLIRFKGNKSKAAQFLGLDRYQLYRRFRHVVEQYDKSHTP